MEREVGGRKSVAAPLGCRDGGSCNDCAAGGGAAWTGASPIPEAAVVLFDTARREEFAPVGQASAVVVVATTVVLLVVAVALPLCLPLGLALLALVIARHGTRLDWRLHLRHGLGLLVLARLLELAAIALLVALARCRETLDIGFAARLRHRLGRLARLAEAVVRGVVRQRRARNALAARLTLRRRVRLRRRRIHGPGRAVVLAFAAFAIDASGGPIRRG
jgi:hypothetical protein